MFGLALKSPITMMLMFFACACLIQFRTSVCVALAYDELFEGKYTKMTLSLVEYRRKKSMNIDVLGMVLMLWIYGWSVDMIAMAVPRLKALFLAMSSLQLEV